VRGQSALVIVPPIRVEVRGLEAEGEIGTRDIAYRNILFDVFLPPFDFLFLVRSGQG